MNIGIIPNLTRNNAADICKDVCKELIRLGACCCLTNESQKAVDLCGIKYFEEDEIYNCADIIISVGGDGSVIHCAKKAAIQNKPVLGINSGRLAFMSGLEADELSLLQKLISGEYVLDRRLVLSVKVLNGSTVVYEDYCINDCSVFGSKRQSMADISASFDSSQFRKFLCDGVIVSTPTGSTGHSFSAGGPVVDPSLDSIVFTPVCPHSFFNRSMIFRPDVKIIIKSSNSDDIILTDDGYEPVTVKNDCIISVEKADFTADFIRLKTDDFIDILYKKLG